MYGLPSYRHVLPWLYVLFCYCMNAVWKVYRFLLAYCKAQSRFLLAYCKAQSENGFSLIICDIFLFNFLIILLIVTSINIMLAAYFSLVVIYNCFAVHVFASDNWNKHIFIQCSAVFEAVLPNINQRFGVYGILLQIGVLKKNPK